jgi:hypothetical protein
MIFVPLPHDPEPDLPAQILAALIRTATRPHLSQKARRFAKP